MEKDQKDKYVWNLCMNISFTFTGTKDEAMEKLKEDMEFLEDDVFTRDSTEYVINENYITLDK